MGLRLRLWFLISPIIINLQQMYQRLETLFWKWIHHPSSFFQVVFIFRSESSSRTSSVCQSWSQTKKFKIEECCWICKNTVYNVRNNNKLYAKGKGVFKFLWWVFKGWFKGVSWVFKGCFMGIFSTFQGCCIWGDFLSRNIFMLQSDKNGILDPPGRVLE